MENMLNRVSETYSELLNCKLVKSKHPSNDNIIEFKKLINRLAKYSTKDSTWRIVLSHLHSAGPDAFVEYLDKSNQPHLLLIIDAQLVVRRLGLEEIVKVEHERGSFLVYPLKKVTAIPPIAPKELYPLMKSVTKSSGGRSYKDAILAAPPPPPKISLEPDPTIKSWADVED